METRTQRLEAILAQAPAYICQRLAASGLRSDGAAGYEVGAYWQLLRNYEVGLKTVVCLGVLSEGQEQAVVEGLAVAVRAVGACAALLRVRCEKQTAQRLQEVLCAAEETAVLAVPVHIEAGDTLEPFGPLSGCDGGLALIQSPAGYAAVCPVLWGEAAPKSVKPLRHFRLKGDVNHSGEILVGAHVTLREVIYGMGCGIKDGRACKAVQIGGPSSGCLTAGQLDLSLEPKTLHTHGLRRGNSTITVLDDHRCLVDATFRFMEHTQSEFCGKCVPCREGTRRMTEIFRKLVSYEAAEEDFSLLLDLSDTVSATSFCYLGQGSGSMLETARQAFSEDFRAHLYDHACPLCDGRDKRLEAYPAQSEYDQRYIVIDPALCKGCSRCAKSCHAEAITGEIKQPYHIDSGKCVKCYSCIESCSFGAIVEVERHG